MKKRKLQLVATKDGSATFYLDELDEHYHSIHGAVQESEHVFIKHGLKYFGNTQPTLNIFEMGLGTGLNVLLTALEIEDSKIAVSYDAIEAYPLSMEDVSGLNYQRQIMNARANQIFGVIHEMEWGEYVDLMPNFKLKKIKAKIEDFDLELQYDLIYYDAFGPRVQEELWGDEMMAKMYKMLKHGGILVTYCAKGDVKRCLKSVGFDIESLPGPPGKREMTRAIKINR